LYDQINDTNIDDKTTANDSNKAPDAHSQQKGTPEQSKRFGKLSGTFKRKKHDDKNKSKNLFSKKQITKTETISKDTSQKKEDKSSHEKKPHLIHDKTVDSLSDDEIEWLEKQIQTVDIASEDKKKILYDIPSGITPPDRKDIPKQPGRFGKLSSPFKRKKEESFGEGKKRIPSKELELTPTSSQKEIITGKSKLSQLSKSLKGSSVEELHLETLTTDENIHSLQDAQSLKDAALKHLGYTEGTWEELDFYPIIEPFAYVEIIREKETLDKHYISIEVELSKKESRILNFLKETLTGSSLDTIEFETKGKKEYLAEKLDQILEDYMITLSPLSKDRIIYFLDKQFLGLDKLEVIMDDPNIEDISCDGADVPIFLYHRKFGSLKGNIKFDNDEELSAFVMNLAQKCGKHISISEPMLDATMPDGSRIQMTLSTEVTTKGSTFTIRKFKEDPFSPPDLIEFNTMSSEMVAYMWMAVENGVNALIAGGTAAGKTSSLNAISLFIPKESKIVTIEETREINLPHPNWIPGVSRSGFGEVVGNKVVGEIDVYDLMKAALRQRPEYILVGEIRGREAYVLFQAMATGHTTYSTVHADSAQSLIHRLEGKPINIPRIMLQALDIVCIQIISRVKNKRARRIRQIIEIIDIDPTTKEILTNEVFRWDPVEDKFNYSGKSYVLERIRAEKDMSRESMTNEIKNRATLLEWMNRNDIREFKKVATLIAQYFEKPDEVMKKILAEG
jgi:flagellar protein FlaI